MPQEEELKFDVGAAFRVPDLTSLADLVAAKPVKTLTATYYDTEDLRLARAGASLRRRRGDDLPWTVKLATGIPGVRQEISMAGGTGRVPEDLVWLVVAITLGEPLHQVATLRTRRHRLDLCDANGVVLAELADDRVTTGSGSFREVEVERKHGPARLLSTVERALLKAGAQPSPFGSKVARALGEPAARPPLLASAEPLPDEPTAAEVLTAAICKGVKRLVDHDPLLRLGEPLPDDDTAVHQMRVACRRLRSDLRTFAPLLDKGWSRQLRDELGWLADLLGTARDAEVLQARLHLTASADPLTTMDTGAVARIDAELGQRQSAAVAEVLAAMRSDRYLEMVRSLTFATRKPPLTGKAGKPASVMTKLIALRGNDLVESAVALTADGPDDSWHRVRIFAKRVRYAAEATQHRKDPLVRSLARLQELLGEHQDAAGAAELWLSFGDDAELAVTAGRLYERERTAVRQAREAFPTLWGQTLELLTT